MATDDHSPLSPIPGGRADTRDALAADIALVAAAVVARLALAGERRQSALGLD